MTTIESRLHALERKVPTKGRIDTIFITILEPGNLSRPLACIKAKGLEWRIAEGETQEVFKARAVSEVPRKSGEVVMMVALPSGVSLPAGAG